MTTPTPFRVTPIAGREILDSRGRPTVAVRVDKYNRLMEIGALDPALSYGLPH